ncbi:MAG: glycosyltransferase family 2 protein [Chloroflexi bacterium]|nr:glycosyltransferase family 2 protein [Chloroflexota bacterium]MCL5110927.1 glycosyltransferase family 2 protein [Chloroflexota bacterium]
MSTAGLRTLSVVVPVYNSAAGLSRLVERLLPVLDSLSVPYEVVMVNDGSRDTSWDRLQELSAAYPAIRCLNLMRNYGQHNALLAGIRAAKGEVIVTMDDDLQNPPEEMPNLLAKMAEGYDVVYGPPLQEQHGLWRDLASQITKLALESTMGAETARQVSAFRAFRTQLRDAFVTFQGPFVSVDVLLTWATAKFAAVKVRHDPRAVGASQYTLRKLVTHALNMMTGFSTLPLQLASWLGFSCTIFGLVVLAYVLGRFVMEGGSVPGFPFLASVIAIFSGAQLFALGIIGEYLARMHFRTMDKPAYAIRDAMGGERELLGGGVAMQGAVGPMRIARMPAGDARE